MNCNSDFFCNVTFVRILGNEIFQNVYIINVMNLIYESGMSKRLWCWYYWYPFHLKCKFCKNYTKKNESQMVIEKHFYET